MTIKKICFQKGNKSLNIIKFELYLKFNGIFDPDPGGQHGSTGSGSRTLEETQQEGICLNAAAGEGAGSPSHNVFCFLKEKTILTKKVKCVLGIINKKTSRGPEINRIGSYIIRIGK
jgi:hypothetical protein